MQTTVDYCFLTPDIVTAFFQLHYKSFKEEKNITLRYQVNNFILNIFKLKEIDKVKITEVVLFR